MYFLWQDVSVVNNFFYLVALALNLTYFWKKLELVAAGGISPIRTDPDLVKINYKSFYGNIRISKMVIHEYHRW